MDTATTIRARYSGHPGTIQKKKLVKAKAACFDNVLRRTISTSGKIKRVGRGLYKL